mmetsp:Transcript_1932/g.6689  ORF Transcript_1932/g.6689 Transcript_1932/m.6689 type:complete len:363 (+) Transcript_1932:6467-7555(+)
MSVGTDPFANQTSRPCTNPTPPAPRCANAQVSVLKSNGENFRTLALSVAKETSIARNTAWEACLQDASAQARSASCRGDISLISTELRSARTSISALFARSPAITASAHAAETVLFGDKDSLPLRAAATQVPIKCATRESRRNPESSSRSVLLCLALSATIRNISAAMSGDTRLKPASSNPESASLGPFAFALTSFFTKFHSSFVIVHCVFQSSVERFSISTRQSPSPAVAVISTSSDSDASRRPGLRSSYPRAAPRAFASSTSSPVFSLRLRRQFAGATGCVPLSRRNWLAREFASFRARRIHSPSSLPVGPVADRVGGVPVVFRESADGPARRGEKTAPALTTNRALMLVGNTYEHLVLW